MYVLVGDTVALCNDFGISLLCAICSSAYEVCHCQPTLDYCFLTASNATETFARKCSWSVKILFFIYAVVAAFFSFADFIFSTRPSIKWSEANEKKNNEPTATKPSNETCVCSVCGVQCIWCTRFKMVLLLSDEHTVRIFNFTNRNFRLMSHRFTVMCHTLVPPFGLHHIQKITSPSFFLAHATLLHIRRFFLVCKQLAIVHIS